MYLHDISTSHLRPPVVKKDYLMHFFLVLWLNEQGLSVCKKQHKKCDLN